MQRKSKRSATESQSNANKKMKPTSSESISDLLHKFANDEKRKAEHDPSVIEAVYKWFSGKININENPTKQEYLNSFVLLLQNSREERMIDIWDKSPYLQQFIKELDINEQLKCFCYAYSLSFNSFEKIMSLSGSFIKKYLAVDNNKEVLSKYLDCTRKIIPKDGNKNNIYQAYRGQVIFYILSLVSLADIKNLFNSNNISFEGNKTSTMGIINEDTGVIDLTKENNKEETVTHIEQINEISSEKKDNIFDSLQDIVAIPDYLISEKKVNNHLEFLEGSYGLFNNTQSKKISTTDEIKKEEITFEDALSLFLSNKM